MYLARYKRYGLSADREAIFCDIPLEEGYVEIAAGMSVDPVLQFMGVEMADGGYIRDEAMKILKQKNRG